MKKLELLKSEHERLSKQLRKIEDEILESYVRVSPIWDSEKELLDMISKVPESLIKFYMYQRIEELKKENKDASYHK